MSREIEILKRIKQDVIEFGDNGGYVRSTVKDFVDLEQALQQPSLDELKQQIIKKLTPHYKDWYARFEKIEIDETGVYALCNKGDYDEQRFIIFKIIDELFETSICSHLKLEQIDLITTYFMRLEEETK